MTAQEIIAAANVGLSAAIAIADLYARATAAANNGNLAEAESYLGAARTRSTAAVAAWDAAG